MRSERTSSGVVENARPMALSSNALRELITCWYGMWLARRMRNAGRGQQHPGGREMRAELD